MRLKNAMITGVVTALLAACGGSDSNDGSSSSGSSASGSSSASSSGSPGAGSITIQEQSPGYCFADGEIMDEHDGFTGDGFVDTENVVGAHMRWQISVEESGVFSVTVRYANGSGSPRAGNLSANGNAGTGASFEFDVATAWIDWTEETQALAMNAGSNTLVLEALSDQGLPNVDYIEISGPGVTTEACGSGSSSSSSSSSTSSSSGHSGEVDIRPAKLEGFGRATTGGAGGNVVYASTGTEINRAMCERASMDTPLVIMVDGTINHSNTTDVSGNCDARADEIQLKRVSNISLIGVEGRGVLDQIGIHLREVDNIIIQNLHIKNVKKSGSPTSNGGDAIGMESGVRNVWVDHNTLEANGGESDGYDSLLDMKAGVENVTVSYNFFRDSSRAGLMGSSDSDDANTNVTFHHNWYRNIQQRTPLIRHGLAHSYNNYWSNDDINYMYHGINSRMGARVLIEGNYFHNTNNPIIASDDSDEPGCWKTGENTVTPYIYYSRSVGNGALVVPEQSNGQLLSTCEVSVPYAYELDHSSAVPDIVMANAGHGIIDPTGSGSGGFSGDGGASGTSSDGGSAASSSASSSSSSSNSSSSSSGGVDPVFAGEISDECYQLVYNDSVNWRESALQSDQEIVRCLAQSLGRPVGFGENARGGYNANGGSNLVVIEKNSERSPEQQLLEAISSDTHNWIVFDKQDFATDADIAMYRLHCDDAPVLNALDASASECRDHTQWCANRGIGQEACADVFFNDRLDNKDLPIRDELIMSNTTIDGRGSAATVLFNGFKIGADSSGASTHVSENVIVTNLLFKGAGHTEDHGLDPDMLRATGESHDIWIHQNSFENTGDSAFDVKVGAYDITISFNRLLNVKRATLHGSSDSRTINAQITTTMHNNLFVTEDRYYGASEFETLRRVPLMRRGQSHMFNNVFYNYRKDILSIRVGGRVLFEDNMVLNNALAAQSEDDDMDYFIDSLLRDFREGGLQVSGSGVWFANGACQPEGGIGDLSVSYGSTPDMMNAYSQRSQLAISANRLPAGEDLAEYVIATAGRGASTPWVVSGAPSVSAILAQPWESCQ